MARITVRLIGALGITCSCAAVSGENEDVVVERLQGAAPAEDRKAERALLMAARII